MKLFGLISSKRILNRYLLFARCGICASVFSVSCMASEKPMDLLRVYELALKNDAQIAAAYADFNATSELLPQGRAALLPNISLTGHAASNNRTQKQRNASDKSSDWNNSSWSASLRQPLFNLEAWFSYSQVKSMTDQARAKLSDEQQSLILRVSTGYFDVLRAYDALETAKAQEKAVKRQMDQTRQRFEVGLIAETDVYEARAVYDDARVMSIEAANQVELALENMGAIINTPVNSLSKLDKRMPVKLPSPQKPEDWVKTALEQNFTLASAKLNVDAAGHSLNATRSKHAPTVDAIASYGYADDESTIPSGSTLVGKSNSTTYSVELNMPLFSGGATSSQVRESGYRKEEAESLFDNTLRNVKAQARNLFRTVNTDVDRIEARCRGIISAKSALRATQSGYEVGIRNIVDVLEAQKSFYAAQNDYFNTRYDFIVNTLKLKQTAGVLSPEDLQALNKWISDEKGADRIPNCG